MNLSTFNTQEQAEQYCAQLISQLIELKQDANIGLATGGTAEGVYGELIKLYHDKGLDLSSLTSFNLDEYDSISAEHPQSYHSFMQKYLFSKTNINLKNTYFPSADVNYDQLIEDHGGIDLQLLGLGTNGHIAFNEPGSSFTSVTRKVKLSASTMKDNSRFLPMANSNRIPPSAWESAVFSRPAKSSYW